MLFLVFGMEAGCRRRPGGQRTARRMWISYDLGGLQHTSAYNISARSWPKQIPVTRLDVCSVTLCHCHVTLSRVFGLCKPYPPLLLSLLSLSIVSALFPSVCFICGSNHSISDPPLPFSLLLLSLVSSLFPSLCCILFNYEWPAYIMLSRFNVNMTCDLLGGPILQGLRSGPDQWPDFDYLTLPYL